MFLFMILQEENLVNRHILFILTCWMYFFFNKAASLISSCGITKCLCFCITSRFPHQQFLSNGLWQGCVGVHTSLPVKLSNPSCCCCCFCPHWVTGMSWDQNVLGRTQVTSHNESQFAKSISETLLLRNHTDWNRRCAGLNMNPTALGQVLWTTGKMVSVWEVAWRSFSFLWSHTSCIAYQMYRQWLSSFDSLQHAWGVLLYSKKINYFSP